MSRAPPAPRPGAPPRGLRRLLHAGLSRAGAIDPATCGVSSIGVGGHGFIAASVARDLAALNKREMLAWDVWGLPLGLRPGGRYRPIGRHPKTRLAAWTTWPR